MLMLLLSSLSILSTLTMGIDVEIVAGMDKADSSVKFSGSLEHVITDQERETFCLNDAQLKKAVETSFGKEPTDAYLHSPTPWGDLYRTYSWDEVQTYMVPTSAEILGITSDAVALKTEELDNNSTIPGTYSVHIEDSVTNTVSQSWSVGGTLKLGQKINYEIGFLGTGVNGETSISYSQSWGIAGTKSTSSTVGTGSGVAVTLQPGQSVVATLSASRGSMKVQVKYRSYLAGQTAVNYAPPYKGHDFYGLDIERVMSDADISNSINATEDIVVGYYSNGKIELKDKVGGALIATHYF